MRDGMKVPAIRSVRLRPLAALPACVTAVLLAACAAQPPSSAREVRIGDAVRVYDLYDNSKPWGSSYLVGPPMHHLGDQSRIDNLRSAPPVPGGAPEASDASAAPAPVPGQVPPAPARKPLPPVP